MMARTGKMTENKLNGFHDAFFVNSVQGNNTMATFVAYCFSISTTW